MNCHVVVCMVSEQFVVVSWAYGLGYGPYSWGDFIDDIIELGTLWSSTLMVWKFYDFQDGIAWDVTAEESVHVPDEYKQREEPQVTINATAHKTDAHRDRNQDEPLPEDHVLGFRT